MSSDQFTGACPLSVKPRPSDFHHISLASPGEANAARQHVRRFFEKYNRHTAHLWNVEFHVIDWENYATIGVGRPQELITQQTLEKFKGSLALVVGIMAQRFGSPTGKAESGTKEEFDWAKQCHDKNGFPEIKWFFRKVDKLELPVDPDEAAKALDQWKQVRTFRQEMQNLNNPIFYTEYPGSDAFASAFDHDLSIWLADEARPWVVERQASANHTAGLIKPTTKYYYNVERDFRRLDIAGIDNDRTFEIPLSDIYVRLRVMFDADTPEDSEDYNAGAIDIQTALLRYGKLVIVGDPGSGKSTFLKYIALMLARSVISDNPGIARERLCLEAPLPIPIFLSCWDLADFLKHYEQLRIGALLDFIADRLAASEFPITTDDVEKLLAAGNCCLLFDGLDEVPSDAGRAAVSRILEECVDRFGDNRFVVTSRIRAYTGDAILKGPFTRCDIQPFDSNDRAEFIRNWVALLFRIPPADVETVGTDASLEFMNLANAIETSDRIRPLAVNPLLLTVIAIVHWNRKRLPEQRVELYDECVDVLLGQRKEAERIQISRKTTALDGAREEQTHEERVWVRKRFAEIALHILSLDGDDDEASKGEVIKLLAPRFIDQGAANVEQASARAERFLERQELRSGLLVSRRAQSYRFVHLTFQEYLAAWQLSNMDFEKVTAVIQPRLRLAKWFETLQLLGAQWAIASDDTTDRYVAWLLSERGNTITDQAPVVALCANVVKDTAGVTELRQQTRKTFAEAVEATLDAFRKASGVPPKTQLEILEALGQLGAAVKSHLIDATKASLFQIRRRAIEMLLPHLSDDELFGMTHLLTDQSQEPIKTFLQAMLDRDQTRALSLISTISLTEKISAGMFLLPEKYFDGSGNLLRKLLESRASECVDSYSRRVALWSLAEKWPDDSVRAIIRARAVIDTDYDVRITALKRLSETWREESTRELLRARAVEDQDKFTRSNALWLLTVNWTDESTRDLVRARAVEDQDGSVRQTALKALATTWPDESTRALLSTRALEDEDANVSIAFSVFGGTHSEFGRVLAGSRIFDGFGPLLNLLDPVSPEHIRKALERARIADADQEAAIASLNQHLGWDIRVGARLDPVNAAPK